MFKLENYLCELSLSYNIKKLFNEVRYTEITPYFRNNPNKDSWFCGPNTWLHGNIKNLNSPELRSLITQLEESIKKSFMTVDDDFIFTINTANQLPYFPFVKNSSYIACIGFL